MTPSAAHDSAWTRTPEHDEMCVAVRDWIWHNWQTVPLEKWGKQERYRIVSSVCEYLCSFKTGGNFFADVMGHWTIDRQGGNGGYQDHLYVAYEVKPKIYSAGALLRQVRVQEQKMVAWSRDSNASFSSGSKDCRVDVVLRKDDPLIDLYARMSGHRVLVWDGDDMNTQDPR